MGVKIVTTEEDTAEDLLSAVSVDADGTRFNSSGTLVDAALDTLRRDHDPSDDSFRGVLFEEERTNIALRSEEHDQSPWSAAGTTVTADQATAPDGTTTADQFDTAGTASFNRVEQNVTVTAGAQLVFSAFVKNVDANGSQLVLRDEDAGNKLGAADINWSGADISSVTAINGASDAGFEDVGDGWFRVFVVATMGAGNTSADIEYWPGSDGSASTIYAWGAQLEEADYPSSYVATAGSAVTRSGDTASLTRTPAATRAGFVEGRRGKGTGVVWQRDDGTADERETLEIDASGNGVFTVVDGGSQQVSLNVGAIAEDTDFRIAWSVEAGDIRAQLNGGTLKSGSGTVPDCTTTRLGSDENGANQFGGWIKRAIEWDESLSDGRLDRLVGGTVDSTDAALVLDFDGETYLTREFIDLTVYDDTVLAMVASVYDETITTNLSGPPTPAGTTAAGAEIDGWTRTGEEQSEHFATAAYISGPSDMPGNTYFAPRLMGLTYESRLFDGMEPAGRGSRVLQEIELFAGDEGLDDLVELGWDGREIALYQGRKSEPFSDFTLVFVGTVDGLSWDRGRVRLALRDKLGVFDRPVDSDTYSGDGGFDGDEDIGGLRRPQCYGECKNVPPQLIDAANLIYQFHDRQAQSVDEVRDKGVALTFDSGAGDVADYDALVSTSVTAGQYATALSQGLIKLGSSPEGQVTADVKGDAVGGYVDTVGTIARRLVTGRLGFHNFSDPGGLDTDAFDQMETDQPNTAQLFVPPDGITVTAALDFLTIGVGAWWNVTATGDFTLGVLKAPSGGPDDTFAPRDLALRDALRRVGRTPSWAREIGYQRVWAVQSADALAGSVNASDKAKYSRQYRVVRSQDESVRTKHRLSVEARVDSALIDRSPASTEAGRQLSLHGTTLRHRYRGRFNRGPWLRAPAEVVRLEGFDRYDLGSSKDFVIVAMRVRWPTVEYDLWG